MHRWSQRLPNRIILAAVLALTAVAQFFPAGADAAPSFTEAYIRLDRMKINTATGFTVCAQPVTVAVEDHVIVTFPTTYTLNATAANYVVDNGIPAGSTFWVGMTSGTTVASSVSNAAHTATFPSGNLVVGTLYCFHVTGTSTVTTAGSAANSQQANLQTQDSGNAVIEFTYLALANNTDDQIVITAVVPPSFILTLSAYADTFTGNLDPTAVVSTNGVTMTVTTNAKGGWIAWAKDQYQGLHSTTTNYTIPTVGTLSSGTYANGVPDGTPSTLAGGTEGFVMDVDATTDAAGGCTYGSPYGITAEYDGNTTSKGGSLMGNFQQIASCSGAAPATANGDVITLIGRAAISAVTPAGNDYTDTITVVGAGNF
jgi:hypothetical protein